MDANELARHKKPFMHELGGKTTKPSFACVIVDEFTPVQNKTPDLPAKHPNGALIGPK